MSVKKLILWFLALTVCLVGGLLLWAFNSDLGRFQPQIEAFLTEQLDRDTRFDDLSIDLGSTIELRATGFRIANVPGATPPDLVRIANLQGAVTLASLFDGGPLVIERLEADGVRVHLAWDENGEGNFQLGKPQTGPAPPRATPDRPLLSLLQSRLTDSTLTLAWPTFENHFDFRSLELADAADNMIALAFDGTINGSPMDFDGKAGPRQELIRAGAVSFEGEGRFDGLHVAGHAEIDSLARPNHPIVQLDLEGDDIREIEALLGMEPGDPGHFQLLLDSTLQGENWIVDLRGHAGDLTLDAYGEADGLQELSRVGLDFHAQGPDLGRILRLFRLDQFRQEPFEIHGRLVRDGTNVQLQDIDMDVGSTRFDLDGTLTDFPHLHGARLTLEIRGDDIESFRDLLGLPGVADGPFTLDLSFEPDAGTGAGGGRFDLMSAQVLTNLGTLDVQGNLSSDDRYVGSTFELQLEGVNAMETLGRFGLPGLSPEPYSLEARAEIRAEGLYLEESRVRGVYHVDAAATGLVGWQPLEADTRVDVELSGKDLAQTLEPLGVEVPLASAPFQLTSSLRATAAGLRFDNLVMEVERSRLEADALIPLSEDLAGLDATLEARGPELSKIFRPGDALDVPRGAWSVATRMRRTDSRLVLENTRITLADMELAGEASLPWPVEQGNGSFKLRGQGQDVSLLLPRIGNLALDPQPFSLEAEATVERGAWRLDPSRVQLGEATLALSGRADRLPDYSNAGLELDLQIPSLAALGTWHGNRLNGAGASLNTRLEGTQGRLKADSLRLTIAESVATGNLTWDRSGDVPYLELGLVSERLDLRPVLPEPQPAPQETPPAPDSGRGPDERLIPDTPLPLAWLDALEGSVDLQIGQILLHERFGYDVIVDVSLEAGVLVVERYQSRGKTGKLDIAGQLTRRDDGKAEVSLDVSASDLLPAREDWQNADPATLPKINAMANVRAVGSNPRELAASLNGRLRGTASEGTLPGQGLGALDAYFLEQFLTILVPGSTIQQPTNLKCFAADILVRDGLVTPEPIVALRTDKLLILVAGSIDLQNERLNLDFQTTPSKLLGASLMELVNPFVSVQGTLANPSPILDPGKTLVYGGAAAATGGLSIVAKGLWDRLRGTQKPCEQLREALMAEAKQE